MKKTARKTCQAIRWAINTEMVRIIPDEERRPRLPANILIRQDEWLCVRSDMLLNICRQYEKERGEMHFPYRSRHDIGKVLEKKGLIKTISTRDNYRRSQKIPGQNIRYYYIEISRLRDMLS